MVLQPNLEVATFRSNWEERSRFTGFNRRLSRWFESPRLSNASVGSNDRASTATLSDCSDFPEIQRPISVVSTISSGSGSSRDDVPLTGIPSTVPIEDNLDLKLTPSGDPSQTQDTNLTLAPSLLLRKNSSKPVNDNNSSSTQHTLSPFASKTMAPNPELTYLDRVVMEILETERMYVRDLRSIVEDYLAHIIDIGDLPIGPEQVCALFGNIEDIYEFNSELLQSLDMCDSDPVAIARCFVLKREYFDIYTQYCTNYPNSVAALTDCMRNKTLAKFFRERQATLKRTLPLGSYLLKPVQRILKYHLLLQEIAKHFDPEEEGYEVVEEAIYTMTGVAWYINDMKRKHEHAVRLQEVQSLLINWKGPDLTTYGELVLEGTFRVHRAKNERTLFLFDRMLLITKRRGEHYVYKTHISCSTLMLIESAKDSMCFSVTHYKHPKQPHTVQARTVEEKKLWAHHIKRLILENHQAVIPQKAKEAILEMDSIYKNYRYSPERLKKSVSCQSEEFYNFRQGDRQSEPSKEILKSTKAVLKHADSEGALPADGRPLQATASVSTLGSSISESEADRPALEEEDSIEALIHSDNEEPAPDSSSSKDRLTQEDEEDAEDEGSDSDDILMEDNQVADFASSMLAAISCWHYRARALLSMGFTTDEEECEVTENNFRRDNGPSTEHEEVNSEQIFGDKSQNLNITSYWGSTEQLKPDTCSDPEFIEMDQQVTNIHDLESVGDKDDQEVPKEETLPLLQQVNTPGESSEDDEDAEEKTDSSSILPSSVLDRATIIAEHFACNARRSSVSTEEVRSLGCTSPHLASRTGSIISLGDTHERPHRRASTCSESHGIPLTQEALAEADFMIMSSRDDNLFDSDRSILRSMDSVLSRQDQLLIDKVRSYYENAEHQDATFSLKRRESLNYIPSGLVRNSVSRFNSIPKDNGLAPDKTTNSSGPDKAHTPAVESPVVTMALSEANLSTISASQACSVISASTNFSGFDKNNDLFDFGVDGSMKPLESQQEEVFRPSYEMIKVWQDMERDVTRCQGDLKALRPRETPYFIGTSPSLSRRSQNQGKTSQTEGGDGLIILEDSDLSTITEESSTPSPLKEKEKILNHATSENEGIRPRIWEEEGRPLRALAPRVIQLRAEAEEERDSSSQSAENADSAQNKVFHLAQKFSQCIKCTQPVLRYKNQEGDSLIAKRDLLSVVEEKSEEAKGKPNLMLSLTPYDQAGYDGDQKAQVITPSPIHTPNSVSSPRVLSPYLSCSRSPLSPSPSENFNWPDVRELRSKYSNLGSSLTQPLVSQSRSVPERMFDGGLRRRSSCTSSLVTSGSTDPSTHKYHPGRDTEGGLARTQRAGSLDHKLGGLNPSDLHNLPSKNTSSGYYVSGRATLPNEKSIIVVEKLPEATPQAEMDQPAKESKRQEIRTDGMDDGYVEIHSPTSREKISIMAVIDRCLAYQGSEEYRLREEGGSRAEQLPIINRCQELEKAPSTSEHLGDALKNAVDSGKRADTSQQGVVKNLREKFQNLK
ncbi:pleckstrin homology domain-containing family G member 3-like [Myxocyprinus asiaticus]|uniref:pleckstrin homology domain-containing family G member 3-like n=1 Tax=Myxocyprinus asiaticus TaxID=70543 RepID=UPI00222288A4|nr:pleckstrin homology domain-containing family G member 3-like [Myxocyprinus asiaticus]